MRGSHPSLNGVKRMGVFMRDFWKSIPRWLQAGWLLPLVLLALPNCMVDATGTGPAPFDPGPSPRTDAVMCDIPKIPAPGWNECATAAEIGFGIPLKSAATALAQTQSNSLALDYSPAATSACGGSPKKIEFHGPFPDGLTVCLNCGAQIPATYGDPQAVCVAKCIDLVIDNQEPEDAEAFCEANARVSTNINNVCFANACSNGGTPLMPFEDPRRPQEKVQWINVLGAALAVGPDLSKVGGLDSAIFDSGAASNQAIPQGDAWIEFEVTENDKSHVIGVKTTTGPDTDPSLADIAFALSLNYDGNVYVLENGATFVSPPIETYMPQQRFRLKIADNNDGTASISYWRLNGPCAVGTICSETQIATQTGPSPAYPLRISASFRESGATLKDVTMVYMRNKPQP
jgi:hypothetical protein